jgi:hypothetical protein
VAELAAVPKVTPKLAQKIHEYFHPPAGQIPDTEAGSGPAPTTAREPARELGG